MKRYLAKVDAPMNYVYEPKSQSGALQSTSKIIWAGKKMNDKVLDAHLEDLEQMTSKLGQLKLKLSGAAIDLESTILEWP